MDIAVIGAGIVGLCTALELTQDGHQVSVFERNNAVAEESSFANTGQLSTSLQHPYAFPSPSNGGWFRSHFAQSGIALGRRTTLDELRWLMRWKAPSKTRNDAMTTAFRLVSYSQERMRNWAAQQPMACESAQGHVVLLRSDRDVAAFSERLPLLKEWGVAASVLQPEAVQALEPALHTGPWLRGAVHFPSDEVGNCRQFAHRVKERLNESGTPFAFGSTVTGVTPAASGMQIQTADGMTRAFDHVVLCTGAQDAIQRLPDMHKLPLCRVWSYSLSAAIREPLNAPRSAVQDQANRTSVVRLGARVRVSAGAEIGHPAQHRSSKTVALLYQTLQDLFPGAADFSRATQVWKGCSLFSADGLPLIGASSQPGLWLNLGHGHNGWSMACGSARLIADMIQGSDAGAAAVLDTAKLAPGRSRA